MHDTYLSFTQHLEELRSRIIKSLVVLFVVSCVLYNFSGILLRLLAKPVTKLVFIEPAEAFVVHIKIALLAGFIISSPFVLYQAWAFISAGLQKQEKKYIALFGPFSFLLFITGCLFSYYIIVPFGIAFLLKFSSDFLVAMISASKYVTFVTMLIIVFGLVFQLPLLMFFLTKVGVLIPDVLRRKRRHAIVIIFIVAASLTPPDVVTQCLLAVPLMVLYEAGILFSKIAYKSKNITSGYLPE